MSLFRRIAVPTGAAMSLMLLAGPATAAPATTVYHSAHAGFQERDGNRTLTVDLDRVDGTPLLDIEWFDTSCDAETAPRTCVWVFRNAYDVVPKRAKTTLREALVVADVTYSETVRTCFVPSDDEEPTDGCTSRTGAPTTAHVDLRWTATGEITQERYRDDEGRLHVTRRTAAEASGTAFGETFPVEQSLITQLSRTVVHH